MTGNFLSRATDAFFPGPHPNRRSPKSSWRMFTNVPQSKAVLEADSKVETIRCGWSHSSSPPSHRMIPAGCMVNLMASGRYHCGEPSKHSVRYPRSVSKGTSCSAEARVTLDYERFTMHGVYPWRWLGGVLYARGFGLVPASRFRRFSRATGVPWRPDVRPLYTHCECQPQSESTRSSRTLGPGMEKRVPVGHPSKWRQVVSSGGNPVSIRRVVALQRAIDASVWNGCSYDDFPATMIST